MEASSRIVVALRKDARERNIEDYNVIFEYFVQVGVVPRQFGAHQVMLF